METTIRRVLPIRQDITYWFCFTGAETEIHKIKTTAELREKRTSIAAVREILWTFGNFPTFLLSRYRLPLMTGSINQVYRDPIPLHCLGCVDLADGEAVKPGSFHRAFTNQHHSKLQITLVVYRFYVLKTGEKILFCFCFGFFPYPLSEQINHTEHSFFSLQFRHSLVPWVSTNFNFLLIYFDMLFTYLQNHICVSFSMFYMFAQRPMSKNIINAMSIMTSADYSHWLPVWQGFGSRFIYSRSGSAF